MIGKGEPNELHHGQKMEKAQRASVVKGSVKLPSPVCENAAGKARQEQISRSTETAIQPGPVE